MVPQRGLGPVRVSVTAMAGAGSNLRSSRQRSERWIALRVRVLISGSRPSAACLTGMRMSIPAPS